MTLQQEYDDFKKEEKAAEIEAKYGDITEKN
jgi:hypothetical protein